MRHSGLPLAIAGSHTSTHTLPEHRRAQNADHLAHNTPFSAFFTKVVCDLGATPPQVAASPSPIRGIARHEPPTRRRHAARRCRVVQNPHDRRCGGHRRIRRVAGLAAVPVGGGWAWPGFKATRRAKLAARTARGRAAAHGHIKQPGPAGHTGQPCPARRPEHPWGHTATQQHGTPLRHNKTARPHWGRAAVAVALGFEPRVAVTPHSISSAAPSAARTRYLTRILYYTLPLRAQIDRAGWEQGHIAAWEQGPTRSHDSIRNRRHLTI